MPLDRLLAAVVRRTWIRDAATGAALAFAAASMTSAVLWSWGTGVRAGAGAGVAAIIFVIGLARGRAKWTRRAAALRVEHAHPGLHNLIVTAAELQEHPARVSSWMRDRVLAQASARAREVEPARVISLRTPMLLCSVAALAWLAVVAGMPARAARGIQGAVQSLTRNGSVAPGRLHVVVHVQPPAYTGERSREMTNPERLDVLEGTRVRLRISGAADSLQVRYGNTPLTVRQLEGSAVAEVTLAQSSYLSIAAGDNQGSRPMLLPVSVTPDKSPSIRIEAPGRDLLLPRDAAPLRIAATATDDFALEALELRYTKVSGSGEQFDFEEGTLPLRVSRDTARDWKGAAELSIAALRLEPGDALVYRAVARDRRPGDVGFASSDTFFVEIRGPGQVPLEGVEMPPDEERYALSQQMVVLKIERLRARERTITRAALEEETALIAAEQRAVRANFIFLMGGHVEDEFEEAEASHEIQEGRLENNARKDISAAIHHMTGAEQGLTAVSTGAALPPARAAVQALQRAFGRNRYILRSLAVRSRIDPSRRMTGDRTGAADWRRALLPPAPDPAAATARELLAQIMELVDLVAAGATVPQARWTELAERALAAGSGASEWQAVASAIVQTRDALAAGGGSKDVPEALKTALAPAIEKAQRGARLPSTAATAPTPSLMRAWAEEVRK